MRGRDIGLSSIFGGIRLSNAGGESEWKRVPAVPFVEYGLNHLEAVLSNGVGGRLAVFKEKNADR